jgi:hypothetical protein
VEGESREGAEDYWFVCVSTKIEETGGGGKGKEMEKGAASPYRKIRIGTRWVAVLNPRDYYHRVTQRRLAMWKKSQGRPASRCAPTSGRRRIGAGGSRGVLWMAVRGVIPTS